MTLFLNVAHILALVCIRYDWYELVSYHVLTVAGGRDLKGTKNNPKNVSHHRLCLQLCKC